MVRSESCVSGEKVGARPRSAVKPRRFLLLAPDDWRDSTGRVYDALAERACKPFR